MKRHRVAVLISGSGSNLQALIDASQAADFPAEIILVISNRSDAYGLTRARHANIATCVLPHGDYKSRDDFDEAIHQCLMEHRIDYVCLAGFMRLLTEAFVAKWAGKMLNIHPSLLPSYVGLNTHARVLADGVKVTGCTVHQVTAALDAGPIIIQAAVPVYATDTVETLQQRVHLAEHIIYPEALRLLINATSEDVNTRTVQAAVTDSLLISPPVPR
ncbi:MAG: phosphoribosylglycinamide formyltransferase [Rickettsiales bacterium]|nr:phosphoribosylglycinamide formyltransferase [Rickettsiales bacterium]